ncbi:MAG: hypothetical protein KDA21_02775 [Phycisphaerales bacterium]|nr:hypothetical protein [Phycisphaerales bacterium]
MPAATGPTPTPGRFISGPINPVRTSLAYRLALLLVTLLMLLLPLIYFSIIVAVGWGVVWHAMTNISVFEEVESARGAFIVYITPIIAGGLIVVLLAKPLFARRTRPSTTYDLEPSQHPQLFTFINTIASDSIALEHGEFTVLVRRYANRVHVGCANILARCAAARRSASATASSPSSRP